VHGRLDELREKAFHGVTDLRPLDKSWDSRTIESGATWRMVFRTPGRFAHFCVFHPNMRGEVRVR
jgi:plastocyanin